MALKIIVEGSVPEWDDSLNFRKNGTAGFSAQTYLVIDIKIKRPYGATT